MTQPGVVTDDNVLFYRFPNLVLALRHQFPTLFESSIYSGDIFFNRVKLLLELSIFDVETLKMV